MRNAIRAAHACFEAATVNPLLGDPFDCFAVSMSEDLIPVQFRSQRYAVLALVPPILGFVFGIVIFWIAVGFRRQTA
jgi:hypothetical protein